MWKGEGGCTLGGNECDTYVRGANNALAFNELCHTPRRILLTMSIHSTPGNRPKGGPPPTTHYLAHLPPPHSPLHTPLHSTPARLQFTACLFGLFICRRFTFTFLTIAVCRVPKTLVRLLTPVPHPSLLSRLAATHCWDTTLSLKGASVTARREREGRGPHVYLNRSEINFGIRVLCTAQT